jgi:hypothetical protein
MRKIVGLGSCTCSIWLRAFEGRGGFDGADARRRKELDASILWQNIRGRLDATACEIREGREMSDGGGTWLPGECGGEVEGA